MTIKQSLVSAFQTAILSPQDHFRSIWRKIDVSRSESVVVDSCGLFAQARVYIYGEGWAMLYLPLENFNVEISQQLYGVDSYILPPYSLLRNEFVFFDNNGDELWLNILLQHIDGGVPLIESGLDVDEMMGIIDELEYECRRMGFRHNSLTLFDVMLSPECRPYLIRYHGATFSDVLDNFDELKVKISSSTNTNTNNLLSDSEMLYTTGSSGALCSCGCGQYVRYRRGALFGFKDYSGEVVIDAKYRWVGDFYENRAVVRCDSGYGVIDSQENFIIEPLYDIIYYNINNTIFYTVVRGKQCTVLAFDYNGVRLAVDDYRLAALRPHIESLLRGKYRVKG